MTETPDSITLADEENELVIRQTTQRVFAALYETTPANAMAALSMAIIHLSCLVTNDRQDEGPREMAERAINLVRINFEDESKRFLEANNLPIPTGISRN